ncbi:MAG: Fe-S cluster assembly protein HesB [Thalassobius sp.]|nr:Fe-S cluster assembly protein HesB [Thalassovita sp.]
MVRKILLFAIVSIFCFNLSAQQYKEISRAEIKDKIYAYWIGQIVGTSLGFPFENCYVEKEMPIMVERYYTIKDKTPELTMNLDDIRGYLPIVAEGLDGILSDDDTDIELVTLHAVEKYGLDLNYAEIAEMWKKHINRQIWVANKTARDLMETGMLPPETGKKENNENWFQIDPQLVNEIWSVFYPGMTQKAAERAEWGARITNDDWGTHPTIAYAVMYSAGFFEKDVNKLVALAYSQIPNGSPFKEGMQDVIKWHKEEKDWKKTRKKIHEKYYAYKKGDFEAPVSVVSSLNNGLCGIMAILYGEGDFEKTISIAVSAGYDCDNQAATSAGLIGIMSGSKVIPEKYTLGMRGEKKWDEPFNDRYVNYSRDNLPVTFSIKDLSERVLKITEQAIFYNGGRMFEKDGEVWYSIPIDY